MARKPKSGGTLKTTMRLQKGTDSTMAASGRSAAVTRAGSAAALCPPRRLGSTRQATGTSATSAAA